MKKLPNSLKLPNLIKKLQKLKIVASKIRNVFNWLIDGIYSSKIKSINKKLKTFFPGFNNDHSSYGSLIWNHLFHLKGCKQKKTYQEVIKTKSLTDYYTSTVY